MTLTEEEWSFSLLIESVMCYFFKAIVDNMTPKLNKIVGYTTRQRLLKLTLLIFGLCELKVVLNAVYFN